MKETFVKDILLGSDLSSEHEIQGWIRSKRKSKKTIFIELVDSTGFIQVVFDGNKLPPEIIEQARRIAVESAVSIKGFLVTKNDKKELSATHLDIISLSTNNITPKPRSTFNIFDERYVNQILNNKHLYIRNPKFMGILKFRHLLLHHMRQWFYENDYIEIAAPVITPVPLYHDRTAIPVRLHGQDLFLTQCAGYYLEAASMAFERVYNISPSFRGEESKSKRHLLEYWHIKAELAFANLEDIKLVVESILVYLTNKLKDDPEIKAIFELLETQFCLDSLESPFPRIAYEEAIEFLNQKGCKIEFGESIGSKDEEEILSKRFHSPFWIEGIPRQIEPFPYAVDDDDRRITRVADLIGSNGYGELLGVAEKIYSAEMLEERLVEKDLGQDERFDWIREVHQSGCVPHAAFGMGVERLIRWLMNIPHVRDVHPFPRTFGRRVKI